jgi:outer membrane protein assembly factor BamD (BamD/ComL family)
MKRAILFSAFVVTMAGCTSEKQKQIDQIAKAESELMKDTSLMVNPEKGKAMKDLYLKFADQYATDTMSANYLFKAADLSNGLRDPKSTVEILDRLLHKFPNHSKCASALFLQAFIYDTELKMVDSAKVKYKEFVQRFPNDPLAPSAQVTLQQLESGISDEELVRQFQMMNDSMNTSK